MLEEVKDQRVELGEITALVVEDDTSGVVMVSMMMRRLGVNAIVETSGEKAIDLAGALKPAPHVILVDLNLPRITGFEVLKSLRRMEHLANTPIIALTAADASLMIPRCQEAGFDGYIAKPIRVKRFGEQLTRVLRGEAVWEGPF